MENHGKSRGTRRGEIVRDSPEQAQSGPRHEGKRPAQREPLESIAEFGILVPLVVRRRTAISS